MHPGLLLKETYRKYAILKVYSYLVKALEKRIAVRSEKKPGKGTPKHFTGYQKKPCPEKVICH